MVSGAVILLIPFLIFIPVTVVATVILIARRIGDQTNLKAGRTSGDDDWYIKTILLSLAVGVIVLFIHQLSYSYCHY